MNHLLPKAYRYGSIAAGTAAVLAIGASQAFAATGDIGLPTPAGNTMPEPGTSLIDTIRSISGNVISILLVVSAVLAVLFLIYSGIIYITSAGNAERAKTARNGVINAVIGIVIIMGAFFIVRFAATIGQSVDGADGSNNGNNGIYG